MHEEDPDDFEEDLQRATKVIRICNLKNEVKEEEVLEQLREHCYQTPCRRQWKVHRCRKVDSSTLDVSVSLRCRYGEDEYILTFLQNALPEQANHLDMEVLVESPGYLPLLDKKYTQDDLLLEKDNNNESNLTRFDDLGLLVCKTRIDTDSLNCIRDMAYRFVQQVEDHFQQHHPDIDYQNGDFSFQEIGSRSGLRYDVRINMMEDDDWSALRQVAEQTGPWLDLVQEIFGEGNWKVEANVIYSQPGAKNQVWHCDGGHMEAEADFDGHGHAAPYALCAFLPLIDLNPCVGFTQFFLGSHKTSELVGFGPAAELLAADFDGILCAGESVVYDYRLMHRGMANHEKLRPIIQLLYTKHFYIETKNYGSVSMYAK